MLRILYEVARRFSIALLRRRVSFLAGGLVVFAVETIYLTAAVMYQQQQARCERDRAG